MKNFKSIYTSFPVQLLVINIRQNHLSMLLWLLLFGFISQSIGSKFGIPYLFLDPEYLDTVGFASFFLLGFSLAAFLVTINLSTYINYGTLFPFLGGLKRPFTQFSINNGMLFVLFLVYYTYSIVDFQSQSEFQSTKDILIKLSGLYSGMLLFLSLAACYFLFTSTDVFKLFGMKVSLASSQKVKKVVMGANMEWKRVRTRSAGWDTSYYLSHSFTLNHAKDIPAFNGEMLQKVIARNQLNAVMIQIIALLILIILGWFSANEYFQIPAGASLLMLFATVVMLTGAVTYWLRGWQTVFWISLILFFGFLTRVGVFDNFSAAYGMDYKNPAPYTGEHINSIATDCLYTSDSLATITILNNWKKGLGSNTGKKPKLILISTSGGGQRATLFTLRCLQVADSITRGAFFKHTTFVSGASGGILGATYFREMCLRKLQERPIPSTRQALANVSRDALNPIALSIAVSDIFIPLQKVMDGGNAYYKDRGYALEKAINNNTGGFLAKRIASYTEPEARGEIPMIIYSPSCINDGRRLIISPQKVAYLSRPRGSQKEPYDLVDGIEFSRFFAANNPDQLLLTSAIRMSASFPYISPNTYLPSEPIMQVIDAGLRDNLGGQLTMRYFNVFKKWMEENTSGVVFIQIRDTPFDVPLKSKESFSFISRMFDPISGFYGNWERFQQYDQENMITVLKQQTSLPVYQLVFQYLTEDEKKMKASISWHLTSAEKVSVVNSVWHPKNQAAFSELKAVLAK